MYNSQQKSHGFNKCILCIVLILFKKIVSPNTSDESWTQQDMMMKVSENLGNIYIIACSTTERKIMHKFWGQVLLFSHGINKYLLFFSSIDHLPIPNFIRKLFTFNILLFELFPLQGQTGSCSMQEQQKGLRI